MSNNIEKGNLKIVNLEPYTREVQIYRTNKYITLGVNGTKESILIVPYNDSIEKQYYIYLRRQKFAVFSTKESITDTSSNDYNNNHTELNDNYNNSVTTLNSNGPDDLDKLVNAMNESRSESQVSKYFDEVADKIINSELESSLNQSSMDDLIPDSINDNDNDTESDENENDKDNSEILNNLSGSQLRSVLSKLGIDTSVRKKETLIEMINDNIHDESIEDLIK